MSSYGSPRKFRSRYKTCHRQAVGQPSSWNDWVDGKGSSKGRPGRSAGMWIFPAVAILLLAGGAWYGYVIQ